MTDVPPGDPRDALIREQAGRIATLEAVVAGLREQLARRCARGRGTAGLLDAALVG